MDKYKEAYPCKEALLSKIITLTHATTCTNFKNFMLCKRGNHKSLHIVHLYLHELPRTGKYIRDTKARRMGEK